MSQRNWEKIPVTTKEERRRLADETPYQWETCAGCGASEKEYFIEHGWSMLVWHPKPDMMLCEYCYGGDDDET